MRPPVDAFHFPDRLTQFLQAHEDFQAEIWGWAWTTWFQAEIWAWAWTTWPRTSSTGQVLESQDGPTSYFGEKIGDDDVIEASEFYDGEKKSETPACMSLMMAKKRPRIDRFYD